jgi:hypothetical protein
MKKVLSVMAIVAIVAVIGTSCAKDCTCKGTMNGSDWSFTYDKDALKLTGLKCSEINSLWSNVEGIECK